MLLVLVSRNRLWRESDLESLQSLGIPQTFLFSILEEYMTCPSRQLWNKQCNVSNLTPFTVLKADLNRNLISLSIQIP